MNFLSDPIWIPLSHRFFNGVAIGSVVLAVLIVVFAVQWRRGVALRLLRLREKLGLTELNPWLVGGLGLVWALLFAVFLLAMFWVVIGILGRVGAATPEEGTDLRWSLLTLTAMTASLGAVISLPFTLIRVTLNRRQTETAEQGMITDRINKAVEGLGADKAVRQVIETPRYRKGKTGEWLYDDDDNLIPALRPDGTPMVDREDVERTEPNLEVRIGAIYALERIAQDSDRDHVQIMEILCAYIRENAPAKNAEPWPEPEIEESGHGEPLMEGWLKRLKVFKEAQKEKIAGLTCRTDIQAAIKMIGRRSDKQRQLEARKHRDDETAVFVFDMPCPDPAEFVTDDDYDGDQLDDYKAVLEKWKERLTSYSAYRLDLRKTNLRGADLSDLELSGARFNGSELQGAKFWKARMQGADLREARMQGADLREAQMQGADFGAARMQGAVLREARMQWTLLEKARMQGALIVAARMQEAYLVAARIQGADLRAARMQGVDLGEARMQGADLRGAQMDGDTDLTAASLRGAAALRSVDFKNVAKIADQLEDMFGDGFLQSAKLPDGLTRPAKWPKIALRGKVDVDGKEMDRFTYEWRKWQKDPEGYTPPEE